MAPTNLYIIIGTVFTVVIGYDIYNWVRGRSFSTPDIRLHRMRAGINSSVFVLGSTLTIVSVCFHVNILNYETPIPYGDVGSITLADFNGYRVPGQTLDGREEFAFITTSIEWEKDRNSFVIMSLFHPSRSYVFNEKLVNKFLLQHELYHFHITEYHARLSRKLLAGYPELTSSDVKTVLAGMKYDEMRMQGAYDHESYHGYVRKEQTKWQWKVDSLLTSVEDFSNPRISLNPAGL